MTIKIYVFLVLGLLAGCYTQALMGQDSENQIKDQETTLKEGKLPVKSASEAFVILGAYQTLKTTKNVQNTGVTAPYMRPMKLVYNLKTQKFEPKPIVQHLP